MNNDLHATITLKLNKSYERSQKFIKLKKWDPDRQGAYAPNLLFIAEEEDQADMDSVITKWASENNINLVEITASNGMISKHREMATVKFTTGGSYTTDYIVVSKEKFDLFNTPNTVLYFKRIDVVSDEVFRRIMLGFVNNQTVTLGDGKVYFAKNILFSILTISDTMDKDARRTLIQDSKDGIMKIYLYEEV